MKKLVLLFLFVLGLPMMLSAERNIVQRVWSNTKKDLKALYIHFSEDNNIQIIMNARRNFYNLPDDQIPQEGFYKLLFDRTEKAIAAASKRGYHREAGIFLPATNVTLPDIPSSFIHAYTVALAKSSRAELIASLEKNPFFSDGEITVENCHNNRDEKISVGELMAQKFLENRGLEANKDSLDSGWEKEKECVTEKYKGLNNNFIEAVNKNIFLKPYNIVGRFYDIESLDEENLTKLMAFFAGELQPSKGSYELLPEKEFLVPPSFLNKNRPSVIGRMIRVYISDNLIVDILPEDLSLVVFRLN